MRQGMVALATVGLVGVLLVALWPQWVTVALAPMPGRFDFPTHLTHAGDGSGRLFVVEKAGRIRLVERGWRVRDEPFVDLRDRVGSAGLEQGLFSVAFHPRYRENGRFYVSYTDRDGHVIVAELSGAGDPNRADPAAERRLLIVEQPSAFHNGGQLQFGPDGHLYIGIGDGGGPESPRNAQDLSGLLGKLLRVRVDARASYAIPDDNPFVGRADARPEIWAYGLRNPWRFSFDRATGDLYIADVGDVLREEVNVQPAASRGGENYGWPVMEGLQCWRSPGGCDRSGLTLPAAEYGRTMGCAVTGGHVYRGTTFPSLTGTYYFADWCSGRLWAMRAGSRGFPVRQLLKTDLRVTTFGEDEDGELFLADSGSGRLFQIVGRPSRPVLLYTAQRALLVTVLAGFYGTLLAHLPGRGARTAMGHLPLLAGTSVGMIVALALELHFDRVFQLAVEKLLGVLGMILGAGLLTVLGQTLRLGARARAVLPLLAVASLMLVGAGRTTARVPFAGILELGRGYGLLGVPSVVIGTIAAMRTFTRAHGPELGMAAIAVATLALIAAIEQAWTALIVLAAGGGAFLAAVLLGWLRRGPEAGHIDMLTLGAVVGGAIVVGEIEVGLVVLTPYFLNLVIRIVSRAPNADAWGERRNGRIYCPAGRPANLPQVILRVGGGMRERTLWGVLAGGQILLGLLAIWLYAKVL